MSTNLTRIATRRASGLNLPPLPVFLPSIYMAMKKLSIISAVGNSAPLVVELVIAFMVKDKAIRYIAEMPIYVDTPRKFFKNSETMIAHAYLFLRTSA